MDIIETTGWLQFVEIQTFYLTLTFIVWQEKWWWWRNQIWWKWPFQIFWLLGQVRLTFEYVRTYFMFALA